MPKPRARTEKEQILQDLVNIRQRILDGARQFDEDMSSKAFVGQWTIMELLAHLAGWDQTNREAAQAISAGSLPAFYKHAGKGWSQYNQLLVERYGCADLDQMIALVADTHQSLITYLERLPEEGFTKDHGLRYKGYKVILGRLLKSEAEDEAKHLEQIERFIAGVKASA